MRDLTNLSSLTTDGSLKEKVTDRTSLSYSAMISTFPCAQRVIARCQSTTFSGSYEALRTSVCSINHTKMVGMAGFEPAVPCSQGRCVGQATLHPDNGRVEGN
jgi:hypothetical protein